MSALLDRLLSIQGPLLYALIAAVVFVEDALFVGFVVPGETAAVLGGVATGLGHASLTVMIVVVAVAIGGDSVGYECPHAVQPVRCCRRCSTADTGLGGQAVSPHGTVPRRFLPGPRTESAAFSPRGEHPCPVVTSPRGPAAPLAEAGPRARLAIYGGRLAAGLSRALGRAGGVIGGRVALTLDPGLLNRLATDRTVVLVSGTNGKSTTTSMLARALEGDFSPAWNSTGANMPDGAVTALLDRPDAGTAVLEIDESYLPVVIDDTRPGVVVLLNLSRDQLDRVGETRMVANRIREALRRSPGTTVIANAADPLVVATAGGADRRIWVRPPSSWHHDAVVCPECLDEIRHHPSGWACTRCDLRRPDADWTVDEAALYRPDGGRHPFELHLPGAANRTNAAFAVAAAAELGVPAASTVRVLCGVRDVAGRYGWIDRPGGPVRLLLAKNPAGWQEVLSVLDGTSSSVVIGVNSRQSDGRDPSWLWDVPFERLRGRTVVAVGDRADDLSVRLHYAQVDHARAADAVAAVDSLRGGPVDIAGDYSTFVSARARLVGV
jgi:UDP-N-acetylmuramyl tripeptide synthase